MSVSAVVANPAKTRWYVGAVPIVLVAWSVVFAQGTYRLLPPETIQQRLSQFGGSDRQRETRLKEWFNAAGCGEHLSEQAVKGYSGSNLICVLPGESEERIVVGAHYDHVDRGSGVADNWSSASLLPSLYEGLKQSPRKHTFVFIAFACEELGLAGSKYYVDHLGAAERSKISAMINMDTLGLGPTEIWYSHADKHLAGAIAIVSQKMKLPVTGMNVDGVGESDGESFAKYKIRNITIHSVTTETLHILHSKDDNMNAIKLGDYMDSYYLIAAYLAAVDPYIGSPADVGTATKADVSGKK